MHERRHLDSSSSRHESIESSEDRKMQIGDWSEHLSSSGKKYYYNCKTEVSQWEKPKDWLEWERKHELKREPSAGAPERHHNSHQHGSHEDDRGPSPSGSSSNGVHPVVSSTPTEGHHHTRPPEAVHAGESQFQDMDISPDATPTSSRGSTSPNGPGVYQQGQQAVLSLAQLPKLLSQLARRKDRTEISPREGGIIGQSEQVRGAGSPTANDCQTSPVTDCNSPRRESPTSSTGGSIHSVAGTSTLVPTRQNNLILTPSLANHYKQHLTAHVTGWQAEHAEKQAIRYGQDTYTIADLNCTKVSADLKICRSLVRVAEIRATVEEQRILFLRQQIEELEELKGQSSYMSTDPS